MVNDSDTVSPVVMGTKMVERVVNMRKLAPPKQDDSHFTNNNQGGKSLSNDSSGFGRTLSKISLDMALRHMVCITIFIAIAFHILNELVLVLIIIFLNRIIYIIY